MEGQGPVWRAVSTCRGQWRPRAHGRGQGLSQGMRGLIRATALRVSGVARSRPVKLRGAGVARKEADCSGIQGRGKGYLVC